jgi:hypothetical protein
MRLRCRGRGLLVLFLTLPSHSWQLKELEPDEADREQRQQKEHWVVFRTYQRRFLLATSMYNPKNRTAMAILPFMTPYRNVNVPATRRS